VTSSLTSAIGGQDEERTAIWVQLPDGYVPLPLDDIAANMARARELVEASAPAPTRPAVAPLVDALAVFLDDLAVRDCLYRGIGRHVSGTDGTTITSSLVVALQEFPERVNPRILLKDLVLAKADAGDKGEVSLVDVVGRPMLFVEGERELPTPGFPGQPPVPEGATSKIFQLEALVPADDGARLVSIEFSTPFVGYGPEFRRMVVEMAASVSFTEPALPPAGGPARPTIADRLRG
jgi:hypothetical protein